MEGFGNIQYQPEIPWLYKSVKSYRQKPDRVEMAGMIFEPVQIRNITDLLNLLADGYTVQKGQMDFYPGVTYTTRRGLTSTVNPNHIPSAFALMSKHWERSHFIFFDIDDCEIDPITFISNLSFKPTGAYHSFNGDINGTINPETGKRNYRFRLIYAFRSPLNKDQWYGAEEYLETMLESENPDVAKIDGCSRNIAQAMHGTNGRNKIIQLNQERWYSFHELDCPEIHKDNNSTVDIAAFISTQWDKGKDYLNTLQQKVVNFKILQKFFGNDLRVIYRKDPENIPWNIVEWNNAKYAYKLIDKKTYLRLSPPKGYNSKTGEGKVKKGKRSRWLTVQAKKIRLIKPDITPQEMIFSLFWLRDKFVSYRDGNDFLGANDIMAIVTNVFSFYDCDKLKKLYKGWIKQQVELNRNRRFILCEYKVLNGSNFQSYITDKTEKKQVRKYIQDLLNGSDRSEKIISFYTTHPFTTPISIVAEELNWDEETVKKYIREKNIIAIPERKPHKPHKLKYTEDEWKNLYDSSLSVRENMRKMKLSQEAFYNHKKRYD